MTDKPALAEVKTLYQSNARDIPAMLRMLAGNIESPPADTDPVDCAVCVVFNRETGRYNIYGWGDTTLDLSLVFLDLAHDELRRVRRLNGALWPIPTGGVK